MSIPRNMTNAHLQAVINALPDELDEAELCALTMTLYSAFIDDPAQIISELLTAIYCFGESRGMSQKTISLGLRLSVDMRDAKQTKQTAH
jgi:hypothetical protein